MATYADTARVAREHSIAPHRCNRCKQTPDTGLSWRYGVDDGTDPAYFGYQCNACGNSQGLSRATILRRHRVAAE